MNNHLPNLRTNIATWAVPIEHIPAVTEAMLDNLPPEDYDPTFHGQELTTTYFDTQKLELRKNRLAHDTYITVRVRCYVASGAGAMLSRQELQGQAPASSRRESMPPMTRSFEAYALSAKTESEKFRTSITAATAALLTSGADPMPALSQALPGHLFARLLDVCQDQPLRPAIQIRCRRYAREDDQDRLTLDLHVRTDTGKQLPYAVCEYKSTDPDTAPLAGLLALPIRPMKLSKFLWALEV